MIDAVYLSNSSSSFNLESLIQSYKNIKVDCIKTDKSNSKEESFD